MNLTEVVEVGESLVEFGLELGEDFVFCPREALEILNPLEVTDGDAAGIAEDVGDEKDVAALLDDGVGLGGGGTVGGFSEDAAFEFGGIVLGDHALEGGGDKGVALLKEEFIGVDGLCSEESFDAFVGGEVVVEGVVVDAFGIPDRSRDIADSGDFYAVANHGVDGVGADVSVALDDGGGFLDLDPEFGEGEGDREGDAVAGGLGAALGALEFDGLPSDDLGDETAFPGGVGVENPGHVLGGGANVGGHDIDLRPDKGGHFLGEAPGQAFLLPHAHGAGVTGDAAFSSAVGKSHEGTFPVHPHRESSDLANVDIGVETKAPLHGATGEVVLNAVAEEDLGAAIVHGDGQGDGNEALGPFATLADSGIEFEKIGDAIELLGSHAEDGVF